MTRATLPDIADHLRDNFEVDYNPTDHVVIPPHIGSASLNTRRALAALTVDNLITALGCWPLASRPATPVSAEVLGATATA